MRHTVWYTTIKSKIKLQTHKLNRAYYIVISKMFTCRTVTCDQMFSQGNITQSAAVLKTNYTYKQKLVHSEVQAKSLCLSSTS